MDQGKAAKKEIEAIDTQTLRLTTFGKAKLTFYPAEAIRDAHIALRRFLKREGVIDNPYRYLHRTAENIAKERGFKPNLETFNKLAAKYNFSQDERATTDDPIILDLEGEDEEHHAPGTYDQSALAKKARKIQNQYTECSYNYDKPKHGDPITKDQVNEYHRRIHGTDYKFLKSSSNEQSGSYTEPDPDREAKLSLHEICDNWGNAVEKQLGDTKCTPKIATNGPRHIGEVMTTIKEEMANSAKGMMLRTIMRHIELYREHCGPKKTDDYIEYNIFQLQPPESVKRGTLLTETEYFRFLEALLNEG